MKNFPPISLFRNHHGQSRLFNEVLPLKLSDIRIDNALYEDQFWKREHLCRSKIRLRHHTWVPYKGLRWYKIRTRISGD